PNGSAHGPGDYLGPDAPVRTRVRAGGRSTRDGFAGALAGRCGRAVSRAGTGGQDETGILTAHGTNARREPEAPGRVGLTANLPWRFGFVCFLCPAVVPVHSSRATRKATSQRGGPATLPSGKWAWYGSGCTGARPWKRLER